VPNPAAKPDHATGGQTAAEEVVATYPCRLTTVSARTLSAQERPAGGRVAALALWRCFLPAVADVQPTDALLIGGSRFEVIDTDGQRTDAVMTTVNLREAR
jgi:hypothetical protein